VSSDDRIYLTLDSHRDHGANGIVYDGTTVIFHAKAEHDPREGTRAPYPWVVFTPGRESMPQRFVTYDGALREVEELAIRHFHLLVSEQRDRQVTEDLEQFVDEITS
jgi:hypothetical protein